MFKLLNIGEIIPSQKKALTELLTKKVYQYVPSITFLTNYQKKKFEKRCVEENIHKSYVLNVDYKYKNDKNKNIFLIYLTKEKAKENIRALKSEKKITIKFSGLHFKKVCRETLNNNYKLKDVLDDIVAIQGEDNPDTYFPPTDNYWTMPPSKEVKLYKQPTQKTFIIGKKKSNKNNKNFIKNLNIKDKIENYYPKIIYLTKSTLQKYLKKIEKIIKAEKKFGKKKLSKNEKLFILNFVSFYNFTDSKGFIFYLTKNQIKELEESRKIGFFDGRTSIIFSTNQLLKTYKEVIRINSFIYYYKDKRKFKNKNSFKPKLLALSDKPFNKEQQINSVNVLDLIDFGYQEKDLTDFIDEKKDLIHFSDDDLIDFDTILPIPKNNKISNNKMTTYYEYGVNLTKGQKTKLSSAILNKTEITLRLKLLQLVGPYKLMLTKSQISKIKKSIVNDKGLDLKISKTQISKLKRPKTEKVLEIDIPPKTKTKTKTKTKRKTKDLIQFSDDDLIQFSDDDLIDLNTILPNPKSKKHDLIDLNTILPNPKSKKHDLIDLNTILPNPNPSTKELKQTIKRLTNTLNRIIYLLKKNNIS